MAVDGRKSERASAQGSLGTAPYLAKITSHLDPTFQGGLEVTLMRESGNLTGDETQTYVVKYAPHFYGTTAYEFMGKNLDFNDTQKSYGFWGVPPDVGVTGIVIFINGDPAAGYWIACVQDKFVNHMIPAIGSTKNYVTEEDYDQDEYDEEGEMAKSQSRTIADAAKELQMMLGDDENLPEWVQKKITLAQEYIDSARDYLAANRPEDEMAMAEVAPPGAKAERMVKHIKKGYAKDGKLTPKEKSIAYATAW